MGLDRTIKRLREKRVKQAAKQLDKTTAATGTVLEALEHLPFPARARTAWQILTKYRTRTLRGL